MTKPLTVFLLLVALGSFLLASCGKKGEQASDREAGEKAAMAPAQAEVKLSENLMKIAEHLGDGGVHFSVTDTKGDLQQMGQFVDLVLAIVPAGEIPPGLRVEALLDDLGLYSLQGRGSSSEQIGKVWHNRSFVLTDGKHEGALSLLGRESAKPAARSFAPAGADLVLETSLDLRGVERTTKRIAKALGSRTEEEILQGFKEEVFDMGINIADFFADFTVRGAIVLWLDEEKSFELQPGMTLPVPHFAARLENAGIIWKLIEKDIRKGSKVVEKDGEIILTPEDGPEETPFGPLLPQVVWNSKTKELFVSLSADDLALCRGEGARVNSSESYQKATAGFPDELSSLAYVSSDVFRLVELLAKEFAPQAPPEAQPIVTELFACLARLGAEGGYAAGIAVQKDGFLALANLPFPVKGDSFVGPGGVGAVASMAGLATPAILKAKKSADTAKTISNAKQIGLAMMDFENTFGEFPSADTRVELESIGEEVPSGDSANDYFAQLLINKSTDNEKIFFVKGVRGVREGDNVFNAPDKILEKGENGFAYIKSLSATSGSSSHPLLLAPMTGKGLKFDPKPFGGKALVLHIDGSVKLYPIDGKGDIVMPDGRGFWARWGPEGFNEDDLVFPR